MSKEIKAAIITGIFSIIAALVGGWAGNHYATNKNKDIVIELEILSSQYEELQVEHNELLKKYQELVVEAEMQKESTSVDATETKKEENKIIKTSLFDLNLFTQNKMKKTTYIKDVFGNVYTEAFEIRTTALRDDMLLDAADEFFLNGKFNKFSCKVFFPENAYEDETHQLIIWGDGRQLGVVTIEKKSGTQSIEVDVTGVQYLQMVAETESSLSGTSLGIIEPYLE